MIYSNRCCLFRAAPIHHIFIKTFDNRIIFINPGRLYGKLSKAVFECDGTGFIRIRDFLKSYPEVTLSVEERGDFFRAELRLNDLPTTQVTTQVIHLLEALERPLSRRELQEKLQLRNREHFRRKYLQPALKEGLIVMCNPDKPRAADQKYRITESGRIYIAGKSSSD